MEVFVYTGFVFVGAKAVRFSFTDKIVGLEGCAHSVCRVCFGGGKRLREEDGGTRPLYVCSARVCE